MDLYIIYDNLFLYVQGLWTTLWLVACSLLLGLLIAIPAGVGINSPRWYIRFPIWCYSYFFRGTPLLVQLYLIYFGISKGMDVTGTPFQYAWFCALLAFTLNTGAYTSEIISGAIKGLNKGEVEAAYAYGMSKWGVYKRIILPSAFRRALPAYSNEVIFMLHGSAIAGIVTISDITGMAMLVNSRTYAPFESYLGAGLFYLVLSLSLIYLFKRLEKNLLAYTKPLS